MLNSYIQIHAYKYFMHEKDYSRMYMYKNKVDFLYNRGPKIHCYTCVHIHTHTFSQGLTHHDDWQFSFKSYSFGHNLVN